MLQAAYDFWRPNKYGIKPYLCKDGRKHPVAIICPGGAYSMVCSFVEGMPIAKALNKCGYHAVVAYYRTKKKARFPNPHEDLKRAITDTFLTRRIGISRLTAGLFGAARLADI